MAQLRERGNDQIEFTLEKRHVVLLGVSVLMLGSLLFLLGILTERKLLSSPSKVTYAKVLPETEDLPRLDPGRSTEPNVQNQNFSFYDDLSGSRKKSGKARKQRKNGSRTGKSKRASKAEKHSSKSVLVRAAEPGSAPKQAAAPRRSQPEVMPDSRARSQKLAKSKGEPPKSASDVARSTSGRAKPSPSRSAKPSSSVSRTPSSKPRNPSVQPDERGIYTIQVVSLTNEARAKAYLNKLKSKGYPAFIDRARLDGGKLVYRVKVGNYLTRARAQTVAARLKTEEVKDIWIHRAAEG